jgi:hypothetical protein
MDKNVVLHAKRADLILKITLIQIATQRATLVETVSPRLLPSVENESKNEYIVCMRMRIDFWLIS